MEVEHSERRSPPSIYIVEPHHEVLKYLYQDLGRENEHWEIPSFIHLDSHPDLSLPLHMNFSRIFDEGYVYSKIGISSWILPAAAAKHLPSITWIKPPWSNQIGSGSYKFSIGKHRGTGFARVTCSEPYFVSALIYSPEEQLEEMSEVNLEVKEVMRVSPYKIKSPYILDVDLDFFSTLNPYLVYFSPEVFRLINELYAFNDENSARNAHQKVLERINKFRNIHSMINHIEVEGNLEELPPSPEKRLLGEILSRVRSPNWRMIETAGYTCDQVPLPHHPSSLDEIDELLEATRRLLSFQDESPLIITVSRSSLDYFCPPEVVDSIQDKVINMFQRLWGPYLKVIQEFD